MFVISATVCKITNQVGRVIAARMKDFVKYPNGNEKEVICQAMRENFGEKFGDIEGVMDGSLFKLAEKPRWVPKHLQEKFFCRSVFKNDLTWNNSISYVTRIFFQERISSMECIRSM